MFKSSRSVCTLSHRVTTARQFCRVHPVRGVASAVLHLQPTVESQRQWFDVVHNSPSLPRSVIVDTYTDPFYCSNRKREWGVDYVDYCHKLGPDFYHALAALPRLPNVSEVALRFTSDCYGEWTASRWPTSDAGWVIEDRERRATILDAFFKATAGHCRTTGNQALQSLTVRNLQNTTCEHTTASDDFRETLKHLTAFHLQICTEWHQEDAYLLDEMTTFWPHLRSRWLEPLADQLETLTLYWDTRWGLFPTMNMQDLHFPKLRSLLLGSYVFGLDEQLRWLLSHKTLRRLSLDACVICSDWYIPELGGLGYQHVDELRMARANFPVAVPFDPKAVPPGTESDWRFKYALKWPAVFEQLPSELPELRDFRFADNWDPYGDEREYQVARDSRFEDRYSLGAEYQRRPPHYVIFGWESDGDGFGEQWISRAYDRDWSEEASLEENSGSRLMILAAGAKCTESWRIVRNSGGNGGSTRIKERLLSMRLQRQSPLAWDGCAFAMWTLSGFALGAASVLISQLSSAVSATSYTNPILPGWHTDPSCVFAPEWDNTTFCTTSSFLAFPGIPIYASKDLTHWRLVSNALNRDSQVPELLTDLNDPDYGILAGTLRIHDGVFYLITVWANTAHELGYFYVFQTTDPYDDAAWSEPLYVPAPGGLRTIDPDIFWDDASGQVVMAFAGSPIGAVYLDLATGNTSDVFDLWQSSAGDFAEGPHLYKRDGYYYLLIAQGGTQIGHKAMLARATSLDGPWEEYPANPWLTNSGTDEYFQTVGHADIFQDAEGNWWGVALSTRGGPDLYNASVYPMGRETVLYPVVWEEGEWPVPQQVRGSMDGPLPAQDPDPPGEGDLVDAPDSVDFTPGSSLPKHWVYWRAPAKPEDFTVSPPEQPGTLRLTASRANLTGDAAFQPLDGLTLIARLQTATYFSFSVDLALGFAQGSGDEAGVSSFLNNDQHVDLGVVYLPGSSSCGALRPHLRFRATALGKENITIPEDVITPLPLSWGGGNVRLALATKNETHFEFTAALASSPENIFNVATFKTDLVSGGGAASGGLMGIYATTNGGNRTVATNAYFSQWRYNLIAQEIDYNVLVGSDD